MSFREYAFSLIYSIPNDIYVITLVIFCVGSVVIYGLKGLREGFLYSSALLLCEYIFLIICTTVIFREAKVGRVYRLKPFWSYERPELLNENIMNVMVFVPLGLLLGVGFRKCSWWKAIGLGCIISFLIEYLQFTFKRGCCELDDLMHNTLGCAIGFGLYKLFQLMFEKVCKRPFLRKAS